MKDMAPTIFVIDDDQAVRESLHGLFRSVGLGVELFSSVQAFLAASTSDGPGCLVLDIRLPGLSGLDFQQRFVEYDIRRPVIFLSGHADIAMSVRAMKAGAIEFLTKPVREQDLLDAVRVAIEQDLLRCRGEDSMAKLHIDYAKLTGREREIMARVVTGRRNKQIAAELDVTEATVKLHRGHIMQKMGARSIVDLVRMGDALDGASTPNQVRAESDTLPSGRRKLFGTAPLPHSNSRKLMASTSLYLLSWRSYRPSYLLNRSSPW
jgi:FixJ family two-component response regulator